MKRMRKVSPGLVCIVLGVVLLLAAGGLYAYNRYEDAHAGAEAQTVVADLQQKVETPEPEAESGPLDPELPVVEIDGNEYVGEISIDVYKRQAVYRRIFCLKRGRENKISLLKILDIHAIITIMMYLVKITCQGKEKRQKLNIFSSGFAKNTMMQGGLHCAEKSSRKKR